MERSDEEVSYIENYQQVF